MKKALKIKGRAAKELYAQLGADAPELTVDGYTFRQGRLWYNEEEIEEVSLLAGQNPVIVITHLERPTLPLWIWPVALDTS